MRLHGLSGVGVFLYATTSVLVCCGEGSSASVAGGCPSCGRFDELQSPVSVLSPFVACCCCGCGEGDSLIVTVACECVPSSRFAGAPFYKKIR